MQQLLSFSVFSSVRKANKFNKGICPTLQESVGIQFDICGTLRPKSNGGVTGVLPPTMQEASQRMLCFYIPPPSFTRGCHIVGLHPPTPQFSIVRSLNVYDHLGIFTPQEEIHCIPLLDKNKSVIIVQRAFRHGCNKDYPRENISRWFYKFEETIRVSKQARTGRPKPSDETVVDIGQSCIHSPRKLLFHHSLQLKVPWQVMKSTPVQHFLENGMAGVAT